MKAKILFLLALSLISFSGFSQSYTASWAYLPGMTLNGDGSLTKTGTSTSWDAGAASNNKLKSGSDGSMEFTVQSVTGNQFMVGFASSKTSVGYGSIEYAFYFPTTAEIRIYESGILVGSFGYAQINDVLKISREGDLIKYYKNGVLLRTKTGALTKSLIIDASIYSGTIPTVLCSFSDLRAKANITTPTPGNSSGAIVLETLGGISPYTYSWSSGETTSSISEKSKGEYSVTITDAESNSITKTYSLGNKSEWSHLVSMTINSDNSLTKTNGGTSWDAGSATDNQLSIGTDGWMEFVINEPVNSRYMLGLSPAKIGNSSASIKYAFYISSGTINIYEAGTSRGQFGAVIAGDVLKIVREGNNIKYYNNGVLLRTLSSPNNEKLIIDAVVSYGTVPVVTSSFSELRAKATIVASSPGANNGAIILETLGGASPYTYSWGSGETTSSIGGKAKGEYSVTITDADGNTITQTYQLGYKAEWGYLSGMSTNEDNSLTKTGAASWNAGASTDNRLNASTDGWIEFVVNEAVGNTYMLGLSPAKTSNAYSLLKYGIYITTSGAIRVFESNSDRGQFGTIIQGDILRIAREESNLKYYRNGILFRTLALSTVDESLIIDLYSYSGNAPIITSSFSSFNVKADIQYLDGTNDGSISLTPEGGAAPYTYQWSSGENTSSIQDKTIGNYSVTVTDAEGASLTKQYYLGKHIAWDEFLGAKLETDKTLSKTTGTTNAYDAGASSINRLYPGQNGWVEFIVKDLGPVYFVGLSQLVGNASYQSIENSFYVNNRSAIVYENGGAVGGFTALKTGDILRISREGEFIKYYHNGNMLRSVASPSSKFLIIDVSIYSGQIPAITSSFDPGLYVVPSVNYSTVPNDGAVSLSTTGGYAPYTYLWSNGETTSSIQGKPNGNYSVTVTDAQGFTVSKSFKLAFKLDWTDTVNVSTSNNNLIKTGIISGWDAGAVSLNKLPVATDGWVEFKVAKISYGSMLGFSLINKDANFNSIDYAIYPATSNKLYIYELGVSKGQFGYYAVGDTLKIERVGETIRYLKNNVLFYTSLKPTNRELGVDFSITTPNATLEDVKASFGINPIIQAKELTVVKQGIKANLSWLNGSGSGRIVVARANDQLISPPVDGTVYSANTEFGLGDLIGADQYVVYNGSDSAFTLTGINPDHGYYVSVFEYSIENGTITYQKVGYPEILVKGYHVQWTNDFGVNYEKDKITKTSSSSSWDGGIASVNKLNAGQNGWVEFTPNSLGGNSMIGLSEKDLNSDYTSIEYAIYFTSQNKIYIYENGINKGEVSTFVLGDVVRIERTNGEVKYFKNGTVIYTSAKASTSSLIVDVSIQTPNSSAKDFRASFYNPQIRIEPKFSHVKLSNDGSICAVPKGGILPYTYSWNTGETTAKLNDKPVGNYTLTVTDALGVTKTSSFDLGYKVQWQKITGAIDQDTVLVKTTTTNTWGNAGAKGLNELLPQQNGWIDLIPGNKWGSGTAGFAQEQKGFLNTSISYGFHFNGSNKSASVNEGATLVAMGNYIDTDRFRVSREGSLMKYYKNDSLLRTVTIDSTKTLNVNVSIYSGAVPTIASSFKSLPKAAIAVLGTENGVNSGSASLLTKGGLTPYTYKWSTGDTLDYILNKPSGDYGVLITDSEGKTDSIGFQIGFKPVWKSLTSVLDTDGVLVKTGANGWNNAGSTSKNELAPNQDGWIEFQFENASNYAIGFSKDTLLGQSSFVGSVYTNVSTGAFFHWNGSAYTHAGYMENGDLIRIARVANAIKYYRNGMELASILGDSSATYYLKAVLSEGNTPIINTSFSSSNAEGNIDDHIEYLALRAIFESAGGKNWTNKTGWPYLNWPERADNTNFANWHGVVVRNGDVHAIELSSNNLKGILPIQLNSLIELDTIRIGKNNIYGIEDLASHPNIDSLKVFAKDNYLSFAEFDLLTNAGISIDSLIPQKDFVNGNQKLKTGQKLTMKAVDKGRHGAINWYKKEGSENWIDVSSKNQSSDSLLYEIDSVTILDEGTYMWEIPNTDYPGVILSSMPADVFVIESEVISSENGEVPTSLKANAKGKYKSPLVERQYYLSQLNKGDVNELMLAPPCLEGQYYAGFQLYYDLGDKNTQEEWSAFVQIKLFKGTDTVWTETLHVDMLTQTFIATAFYKELVSCDEDYQFEIAVKNATESAPQENIHLKILLYKHLEDAFVPTTNLQLTSAQNENGVELGWTYEGPAVLEFDVEWVFVANYEGFQGNTPTQAFQFKEPVRITTADYGYKHHTYYPEGNMWYRVRAIGYNPEYPNHRIAGDWFYDTNPVPVNNHANNLNWQEQTTFAEEGKYKKVMSYFDGSLRQRQVQTNLSSEGVTLVAESLYDFEGRQSVSIMASPTEDESLEYKAAYHSFEALHDSVEANTSSKRKKFHYDNLRLENSILSDAVGAARYYSPNNVSEGIHKDFIPDAEGHVYSQTEYLNDGTGKVSRQSGVGSAFKMEGDHTVKNFYAEANTEELVRLFGSNVGSAQHYKKNSVVDANGQVSISYLDQAGRVIATALAGDTSANLEALPSYLAINPSPIKVDLKNKNTKTVNGTTLVQKIMNTSASTVYTINYKLEAFASLVENFGCQDCTFDVNLSITDPKGQLIELPILSGNEDSTNLSFKRSLLTASDCSVKTTLSSINFQVLFSEIGDYTLVKTLKAHEMSFEQMEEKILQEASVIQEIEQIWEYYPTDPNECEICIENCEGTEELINETISEVAAVNCTNLYTRIVQDLKAASSDDNYEPSDSAIQAHGLYCQYELCLKDSQSDVFDMKLTMIPNWSTAQSAGFDNPLANDPFFNVDTLNGDGYLDEMQARLSNVFVGTVRYDSNGDGEINQDDTAQDYEGPINEVTDPENTDYYVGVNGQHNVTGRHLLYMDLMNRRASLGEAAYQNELNTLRWNLYRGYYMEAKRKTKLEDITAYNTCDSARVVLEITDNLPTTEQDVIAWGNDEGYTGPISDEELDMSIRNISFACDTAFSALDSTNIQTHLAAYFNANPSNFFKIILNEDLGNNQDLLAIDNILENYGCSLDRISMDNPITCLRDTTIVLPNNSPILIYNKLDLYKNVILEKNNPQIRKSKSTNTYKIDETHKKWKKPNQNFDLLDSTNFTKIEPRNIEKNINLFNKTNNLSNNKQSASAAVSFITTETEYQALVDLFVSTNGNNWNNKAGWQSSMPEPGGVFNLQGWHGVTTDENGHVTQINLINNNLSGSILESINGLSYLRALYLSTNHIDSLPANFGQGWSELGNIMLSGNDIRYVPEGFGSGWSNVRKVYLDKNDNLRGIPNSFGSDWVEVREVWLCLNPELKNNLPDSLGFSWSNLTTLHLHDNQMSELPNVFGTDDWVNPLLLLYGNLFTFESILDILSIYGPFDYSPQDTVDVEKTIYVPTGSPVTLSTNIDRGTDPASTYQWQKNVNGVVSDVTTYSETNHTITIPFEDIDFNAQYFYNIKNSGASDLTLMSHLQTLIELETGTRTITYCLEYDTANVTLAKFQFTVDWNQQMEECLAKAASVDSSLVELATEKFIEEKVSSYYNSFRTQCIDKLKEKIDYTFSSKEYHYTLYHYDQAGSLVQTVPPQGVHPLSAVEVDSLLAGDTTIQVAHSMQTRYQYNSLNQLTWQQTPDAGQSKFWYNAKSQLRLSQNAQQALDNAYSYTKYDVLGRIVEVGELTSADELNSLLAQLDDLYFPSAADSSNALSDITKTHYDFASLKAPAGFVQENLRNRVAWVEVIDKNSTDTTATFYSYDIHGNVKSLVQFVPGLEPKRTDYRYDLVSGNVNYVFYQAEQPDQFIHRYEYDSDNRIRKVFTSTDGFIWYEEATYFYYQHGPLARVELGEHHTQGIDYYYTLQGWLKGANMPYQGDPGNDGQLGSGADAFAFNLGYYQGDYKAIGAGVSMPEQTTTSLWASAHHLFNGNIAWMLTDLPSLGLAEQDRSKGMQAMQYKYDQLNRIQSSKSLLQFSESTGFAQRTAQAQAYDEAYTYDANGNILSLKRHDEEGALKDDFEYTYYAGTNKLQRVEASAGTTYEYDAIGNLIKDNEEGTQISWTPYGKVREVHKGDSLIIKYRYDASGNRVEKKVITLSSEEGQREALTRYIRDASGNVMAVYKSTLASDTSSLEGTQQDSTLADQSLPAEYHLYGSSRLGLSTAKARHGHLTLGMRSYELSNHLGNVLAVVSDKANFVHAENTVNSMWYDQAIWATVQSTSDYYPFGLQMAGRTTYLDEVLQGDTTQQQASAAPKDYKVTDGYQWGFNMGSLSESNGSGMNMLKYGAVNTEDANGELSAFKLDGTDDYLRVIDDTRLDFGNQDFTVAFRFKKYAYNVNWANGQGVNKWNTGGSPGTNEWALSIGSGASGNNPMQFTIESGNTSYAVASQTLPNLNEWFHVLGQRKGDSLYIYVNGTLEDKLYIGQVSINNVGRDMLIGRIEGAYFSNADFDEVYIVPRALNQDEISYLYRGLPGETINELDPALTPNLVARYTFTGNANDVTGNQQSGTPINGPVLLNDKDGRLQQAYSFDGVNDHIKLADNTKQTLSFVQNTGVFTIATYVKINDLNARGGFVASAGSTTEKGFNFMYENYSTNNHVLSFSISKGVSGQIFVARGTPYAINDNNWHHVAVVGDGQNVRFYIDGVQDGSAQAITQLSAGDATRAPILGGFNSGSTLYAPLKGAMDEVTIFNKALSQAEIQSLMQSQPVEAPIASAHNPAQSYRYGFNGKEKDTDFANNYDYGFRIYNPRIAKFLSVDPLTKRYSMLTPYQFASNMPTVAIDLDGLEGEDFRFRQYMKTKSGITKKSEEKLARDLHKSGQQVMNTMLVDPARAIWNYSSTLITGIYNGFFVYLPRELGASGAPEAPVLTDQGFTEFGSFEHNERLNETTVKETAAVVIGGALGEVTSPIIKGGIMAGKNFLRKDLAESFYKKSGLTGSSLGSHLKYYDFDRSVYTKTIEEGTELVQYRMRSGAGAGDYYAPKGTTPSQIGLDPKDVVETYNVTVDKATKGLYSKHVEGAELYYDPSRISAGGGTQIYSTELKSNATFTPVQ